MSFRKLGRFMSRRKDEDEPLDGDPDSLGDDVVGEDEQDTCDAELAKRFSTCTNGDHLDLSWNDGGRCPMGILSPEHFDVRSWCVVENATQKEYLATEVRPRKRQDRVHRQYLGLQVCAKLLMLDPSRPLMYRGLCRVAEFVSSSSRCVVVTDVWPDGVELFEKIIEYVSLDEHIVRDCIKQLLLALSSLHKRRITHRGLMLEHIVVREHDDDDLFDLKLTEYDCRQWDPRGHTLDAATKEGWRLKADFVSPDVLKLAHEEYLWAYRSDCWGVGVLCYLCLGGYPPFFAENVSDTLTNISNPEYVLSFPDPEWTSVSQQARDFIIFVFDSIRHDATGSAVTAEVLLRHPWLTSAFCPAEMASTRYAMEGLFIVRLFRSKFRCLAVDSVVRILQFVVDDTQECALDVAQWRYVVAMGLEPIQCGPSEERRDVFYSGLERAKGCSEEQVRKLVRKHSGSNRAHDKKNGKPGKGKGKGSKEVVKRLVSLYKKGDKEGLSKALEKATKLEKKAFLKKKASLKK